MEFIKTLDELRKLYGRVGEAANRKVSDHLTPVYSQWITASKFCVISTVGKNGTDGSPRGEDGPVVRIVDKKTLQMPDWRGNNRIDSLRNIIQDDRVSLMFMISGVKDVVRVNGNARLVKDEKLRQSFGHEGNSPTCIIQISILEVYVHCPKSILRSQLWNIDETVKVPTIGEILAEVTQNKFVGEKFDLDLSERVKTTLWT